MGWPLRHRLQVAVSRQVAVLPPPTFPPSEGAQFPREIVPPSEGEFLGHVRHSVCSGVFLPFSPFPPSEGESSGDVRHSVCSGIFLPFRPFPPSEGVQFPLEIVPPSEGEFSGHVRTASVAAFSFRSVLSYPPTGPAPDSHPESAGSNGLSPSPSGFRYKPTCLGDLSRRPCPRKPSGKCRVKRSFSTTFSDSL